MNNMLFFYVKKEEKNKRKILTFHIMTEENKSSFVAHGVKKIVL